MSTLLFHGPRAREKALEQADQVGRLLASPFGDEGLKADAARAVVALMSSTPIGDAIGVVVVGPMDEIPVPGVADTLLKTLEEFPPDLLQPILWAKDIGGVSPTVRSRSLATWCPGESNELEAYMASAEEICRAALRRKSATLIELLTEHKGDELEILRASTEVLVVKEWPIRSRMTLWESLRTVLSVRGKPTFLETLSAYML
jgi:hypothetical protein